MNRGRTIFSQVMKFLSNKGFAACVPRYGGDRYVKSFSCLDQCLCMAFAQLAYRESLRDIECCLRAYPARLYHTGIRGKLSNSTHLHANERRDWRIRANLAQVLISEARKLYRNDEVSVKLSQTAYTFDSTTIDLCLSFSLGPRSAGPKRP